MRRYLVVANQTLSGDALAQAVVDRVAAGECEFWVVAPATPVKELVPTLPPVPVIGGVAAPWLNLSPDEARRLAQDNLQRALDRFRAAGATADGQVGDPDPVRAAQSALTGHPCDEIIVGTLPARISRWLRLDLPRRLEHGCGLPVTHIQVGDRAP